jgi:hypothetical protein
MKIVCNNKIFVLGTQGARVSLAFSLALAWFYSFPILLSLLLSFMGTHLGGPKKGAPNPFNHPQRPLLVLLLFVCELIFGLFLTLVYCQSLPLFPILHNNITNLITPYSCSKNLLIHQMDLFETRLLLAPPLSPSHPSPHLHVGFFIATLHVSFSLFDKMDSGLIHIFHGLALFQFKP